MSDDPLLHKIKRLEHKAKELAHKAAHLHFYDAMKELPTVLEMTFELTRELAERVINLERK